MAALFLFVVAVFHSAAIAAVVTVLFGGVPIWWPSKSAHAQKA
jgi:heme/copper-type cytochrome/quinol oxidase subunit 1